MIDFSIFVFLSFVVSVRGGEESACDVQPCGEAGEGDERVGDDENNLAKSLSPLGLFVHNLPLDDVHPVAYIVSEVADGDGERLEAVVQRRFHLVHPLLYLRHAPVERGKVIRHLAGLLLAAVLHHAHRCLTSF